MGSEAYDAIIIGAGIGGLVCGCYLAKAGMKVLICEQHYKPGGYCTSFKRGQFMFNAAVQSFGGYRKHGIVRKVFSELGINKSINIRRMDPTNIILTPDYKVTFWNDINKTIQDILAYFPNEKDGIKNFFNFLETPNPKAFTALRNITFKQLMDKFLKNDKLKAILSVPLYGNGALPPSKMSAFIGVHIINEFILDGGYYPKEGMQALPDALVDKFREFGGELRLSSMVEKILIKSNKTLGIVLEKNEFIPSKYIISNCDARQTFLKFLDKKIIPSDFLNKIKTMDPSLSGFVLYLGIDKQFEGLPKHSTTLWFQTDYDLDKTYLSAMKGEINSIRCYMLHFSREQKTITVFVNVPFKNKHFWHISKNNLIDFFLDSIEKNIIPNLSKHIAYKCTAIPHTLYKYTLNYHGAAYGWAWTPSQLAVNLLRNPSFIQGLYLTGHWTTQGFGIPGVTYTGYDVAKRLLRKDKICV